MKRQKNNFAKGLFTILIALISVNIKAQDTTNNRQKGNILVSGGALVHYTTQKFNNSKNTSFTTNITPKAGYFIMNGFAVGIEFLVKTSKETRNNSFLGEQIVKSSGYSVAPFARYYLKNGFFAEGLVGLGSQKNSISGGLGISVPEPKTNTFGFRVGAGYVIDLGNHVAIEPSINYSWENHKRSDEPSDTLRNTISSIFLGINLSVFL